MRFLALALGTGLALGMSGGVLVTSGLPLTLLVLNTNGLRTGQLPDGWQLKVNRGTPDISVVTGPSGSAIRLKSDRASFSLERAVDVDPGEYPVLSWTWKVTQLPQGGDFRHARTDDQAAQVLVAFADRRIMSYIWDTSAPRGAVQSTSLLPLLRISALVCRSGSEEANRWLSETRDLAKDYEAAFGKKAGRVKGVRLQINSQHTGTMAESYFAEVAFLKNPR